MKIKTECGSCGCTNIQIDCNRHMIWCYNCGEFDQISIKEYDFEEVEE